MNGTIITDVKVYSKLTGKLVFEAHVGDKVVGDDSVITEIWRNGISKLPIGNYVLQNSGCVAWDTVTPPPDPTVTEVIEYHRTENGVTTVTRFIPE